VDLIDTHCHLTFEGLIENVEGVVQRSVEAGVTGWVTVGTDNRENRKVVELAEQFKNMYAAVGIHPHEAKSVSSKTITELEKIAQNEKVVAIGETGLDFHHHHSAPADQQRVFIEHLRIAAGLNMPVIVHCREAFDETMDILERFGSGVRGIVFHCFGGSAREAERVVAYGYYISFTGVVTFKNGQRSREAAKAVPIERLMVETDCPYMSPEPMRKQKINEPALMVHTLKCLSELKEMGLEDFGNEVTATSRNFFALPRR